MELSHMAWTIRDSYRTAPRIQWLGAVVSALIWLVGSVAWAQPGVMHYFHSADLPPGVVGQGQLLRGGPLPGYFQPTRIEVPDGAKVALAVDGNFEPVESSSVLAGMLIGQVYRLRITGIPRREGLEVFPTVELINRLYPPRGLEAHYPIPVVINTEELQLALDGSFITRVIYLENPDDAIPVAEGKGIQRYYDVRTDQDPLEVADRLGRPVAILRIGSRVPDFDTLSQRFTFGCPPIQKLAEPPAIPDRQDGLEEPLPPFATGQGTNVPRLPLPREQRNSTLQSTTFRVH